MSDLKPYSGVRCMCLVTGCSAGAGCPHYTDHCKAHIQHQNKQPAQAGQVLSDAEQTQIVQQVEALLDAFIERDPDRAARFMESTLAQISLRKRLQAKKEEGHE